MSPGRVGIDVARIFHIGHCDASALDRMFFGSFALFLSSSTIIFAETFLAPTITNEPTLITKCDHVIGFFCSC